MRPSCWRSGRPQATEITHEISSATPRSSRPVCRARQATKDVGSTRPSGQRAHPWRRRRDGFVVPPLSNDRAGERKANSGGDERDNPRTTRSSATKEPNTSRTRRRLADPLFESRRCSRSRGQRARTGRTTRIVDCRTALHSSSTLSGRALLGTASLRPQHPSARRDPYDETANPAKYGLSRLATPATS